LNRRELGARRREILGLGLGQSEAAPFWIEFLRGLVRRGLKGVKLVISDAHEGLKAAITQGKKLIDLSGADGGADIEDLLRGDADVGRLVERAEPFGLDMGRPHQVALAAPTARLDHADATISALERAVVQRFGDRDVLVATSQRDLFASSLLPTRMPAEVARAIGLERQSSYVGDERLGRLEYTVAAVPIRDGESGAILTVPLTLRQQEIEGEVAALDRRVVLAAVLFILLGAAIGYVTAERLGDPIQRLTRATGRIARGDLNARILTAPADELGRLVEAFNQMAEDLQRQRAELERTNRLAAWADMARQVAHDIKNPLTPIQLQAEFLRRVHADSGSPLGAVVDTCVAAILSQVSLLRSIASEFSSFASSPVAPTYWLRA